MTYKYAGTKERVLVYALLTQAARFRGTVTYQELAEIMGLPLSGHHMGAEVGAMVGGISEEEHANGRPLLGALVVRGDGAIGDGFFTLARDLGRLGDATAEEKRLFWEQERKDIYDTWRHVPRPPLGT